MPRSSYFRFGSRREPSVIFNPRQDDYGDTSNRSLIIGLRTTFKHRFVFALNVGQTIVSLPCIVVGSAAIISQCTLADAGVPIWGGLVFLAAGIQGLIAARRKNTFTVFLAMILSTIALICSLVLTITSTFSVANDFSCHSYESDCPGSGCVVGGLILLISGISECGFSLLTVIVCAIAVCSCRTPSYQSGRPYIVHNNTEPQPLLSTSQTVPRLSAGTIVVDPGRQAPSTSHTRVSGNSFQMTTLSPNSLSHEGAA